jgi:hypothetical protein
MIAFTEGTNQFYAPILSSIDQRGIIRLLRNTENMPIGASKFLVRFKLGVFQYVAQAGLVSLQNPNAATATVAKEAAIQLRNQIATDIGLSLATGSLAGPIGMIIATAQLVDVTYDERHLKKTYVESYKLRQELDRVLAAKTRSFTDTGAAIALDEIADRMEEEALYAQTAHTIASIPQYVGDGIDYIYGKLTN